MDLAKQYNPKEFEEKCFSFWQDQKQFHAEVDETKKPFTIVIPPPNVTAKLHMGHGLNNSIQDILIRWRRMKGENALWIPGTDHAGIATQNVVERKLQKKGKTRHSLSRTNFIDEVWKWKKQYGSIIIEQLKKMGSSCDWRRERFTMDPQLSKAVREVFVRLYEEGLIYQGNYIVNWCPRCTTALSNEEVEYKEINAFLYYVKYPLESGTGYIPIATTRPETILGDGAVAVNPKSKKYKQWVGQSVILPLKERIIPIIEDDLVDEEFGTAAVKVTPAHDPNDFIMGTRHGIPMYKIMNPDATMNSEAGPGYEGMDRFECRKKILQDLKDRGYFLKQEPHKHSVGHCYRCETRIEPYLSKQWFVRMQPLAKKAIEVVETGQVTFYPEKWKKVYLHWMYNIQDWCISRQIWWGHRLPVWTCNHCNSLLVLREDPKECGNCSSKEIHQVTDVLDTWFSSMLWPFSTLGWPDKTKDLQYFYPTTVLSTASEILFFWVARMIMAGLYCMKEIPFQKVYIHSTVRDKIGRKMSKSLGNGIDPLEVIQKHGADALRFTIIQLAPIGGDIRLAFDQKDNDFLIGTRFANKIWNASRYILMNWTKYKESHPKEAILNQSPESLTLSSIDRWILSRLQSSIVSVENSLEEFRFQDLAMTLYNFIWHDFCDWYLEFSKPFLYRGSEKEQQKTLTLLLFLLREGLKLLHPVMPFLTEEIWQKLPHKPSQNKLSRNKLSQPSGKENSQAESNSQEKYSQLSIMTSEFPSFQKKCSDPEIEKEMSIVQELVSQIRTIRAEFGIRPDTKVPVWIRSSESWLHRWLKDYFSVFESLAKVQSFQSTGEHPDDLPTKKATAVGQGYEIWIPISEDLIDLEKERARLKKEILNLEIQRDRNQKRLKNPSFLKSARKEIVIQEQEKEKHLDSSLKRLTDTLSILSP